MMRQDLLAQRERLGPQLTKSERLKIASY